MTTRTILVTGFDPFGGEAINPSWEIARALDGVAIAGGDVVAIVHARRLPCVFGAALTSLNAALDELQPAVVLALGQAGGRTELSLERIAINVDDARIADNDGAQPVDTAIVDDGPAAYFTTLPIKAMVAGLRAAGHPAGVSQTAGTFVCNHVFYGLQHALRARVGVKSGFMHIPYLPEQSAHLPGSPPSMALPAMVAGTRLALEIALGTGADLRVAGGAIS